jgi:signal peptidase I
MKSVKTIAGRRRARQYAFLSVVASGFSILLTVTLLVVFAPVRLGGEMTLLVVNGTSMEPGMHTGDFAFVSRDRLPHVGEIAAYRSPTLGVVIHRVIADDGSRLTLLGDNRTTVDPDHPTYEEVVGRLVMHVPGAARYLRLIGDPRAIAVLVAASILAGGLIGSKKASTHEMIWHRMRHMRPAAAGMAQLSVWRPFGVQLAGIAATLVVASVALFVFVARSGYTQSSSKVVAFSERGVFDYASSDVPAGLYPDDRLAAPQPVVRGATKQLNIIYDYSLGPKDVPVDPGSVSGSYAITAEIAHDTGWRRDLVLVPPTAFSGDTVHVTAPLVLSQLEDLAARLESALKIQDNLTAYSVRFVATVSAKGTAAGQPFARQVSQSMQFAMTNRVLTLDRDPKNTTLSVTTTPTVTLTSEVARHLNLPIVHLGLPYKDIPWLAWGGMFIGVGLLAVVAVASATTARAAERSAILSRHRDLLVDVTSEELAPKSDVVLVRQFDDLTRIALMASVPVMRFVGETRDLYAVQTATQTFVYHSAASGAPQLELSPSEAAR